MAAVKLDASSRAWGNHPLQSAPGLRVFDTNPQEFGHVHNRVPEPPPRSSSLQKEPEPITKANPTSNPRGPPPEPPIRSDSLPVPITQDQKLNTFHTTADLNSPYNNRSNVRGPPPDVPVRNGSVLTSSLNSFGNTADLTSPYGNRSNVRGPPPEVPERNGSQLTHPLNSFGNTANLTSQYGNRSNLRGPPPEVPERTSSLPGAQTKMMGAAGIAQISQDIGKGMASTLSSEKNAYNTQNYLGDVGAPGTHGDWHAQMAKQLEDANNNRSNAYAHVGAMFGPLGMLLGQMGAELSQKKVDYDSDTFKTSRTFSGNFNPQAFSSVNAATSINQNNESHIQSTT